MTLERIPTDNPDYLHYVDRSAQRGALVVLGFVIGVPLVLGGIVGLGIWFGWPCFTVLGLLLPAALFLEWLRTNKDPATSAGGRELPMTGAARLEFDRQRGELTATYFGTFRSFARAFALRDFTICQIGLLVTRRAQRTGESRSNEYLLHLIGPTDAILIDRNAQYQPIRTRAVELASFLQFPVLDAALGEAVVLRPETLTTGVRERPPGADPDDDLTALAAPRDPRYEYTWKDGEFHFRVVPDLARKRSDRIVLALCLIVLPHRLGGGKSVRAFGKNEREGWKLGHFRHFDGTL